MNKQLFAVSTKAAYNSTHAIVISEEVFWLRLNDWHCSTSKPNPWHLYPLIFIDMTVSGSSPAFSTLKLFLMAKSGLLVRRPTDAQSKNFTSYLQRKYSEQQLQKMIWFKCKKRTFLPSRHSIKVDWGTLKRREAPWPGSLPPTLSSSLAPWPCTINMSNTVRLFLKNTHTHTHIKDVWSSLMTLCIKIKYWCTFKNTYNT